MAFTEVTSDISNQQKTKYTLSFDRIPNTTFFCQKVNLPGVSIDEIFQPTPIYEIPRPGTKIAFEPLRIEFLIDVGLKSWFEVHDWLASLGIAPDQNSANQYAALIKATGNGKKLSDAILTINNNQNVATARIQFKDCWPQALSDLDFDVTVTPDEIMKATATFRYTYYTAANIS